MSIFIKRSGDSEAVFAEIEIFADDNVSRLADRASLKFHWNVSADKIKLYLVPVELSDDVADGKAGCEALVLSNPPLSSIKNLSVVGISNGSCLLARVTEVSISPSLGRSDGNDMTFSFPQIHPPVVDVTIESLLIAGGVASPQESVIRRAYTRYGGAVVAALAGRGRIQAAVDVYRLAESLPSLTTVNRLQLEGITISGPLSEGSPVTRCFRNRTELVLKPLDKREYDRALEFFEALNDTSAISGLTPFELRSSAKGKHFMLMPVFGASIECLPHLDNEDITELWRCMRNALRGLHGFGFAHMDIKPANICLDRRAFVLIDLGSVTRFGEEAATTPPYVARDFPGGMLYSSALADWWLLAMTLAEKATGLRVGEVERPTMVMLSKRLEENLPPAVWAELREEMNA